MNKQNLIIYDFSELFSILNEIKKDLSFNLINVSKREFSDLNLNELNSYLIITKKEISKLQNQLKVYTGTFVLGSTTPSFDLESKIDNFYKINHIDKNLINKVLPNFIGDIYQTPPIYSAIKKKGKRLYELAREGKKTEIKARKVFVEKFEITKIKLPEIDFLIKCGKGTYIRSIANDFGKALNSGAHLKSLRRISSGKYLVKNAIKFTFN